MKVAQSCSTLRDLMDYVVHGILQARILEWVAFLFFSSKITADGDCSDELKRRLLLRRKAVMDLDSVLKSRDITMLTKVHNSQNYVFSKSFVVVRVRP